MLNHLKKVALAAAALAMLAAAPAHANPYAYYPNPFYPPPVPVYVPPPVVVPPIVIPPIVPLFAPPVVVPAPVVMQAPVVLPAPDPTVRWVQASLNTLMNANLEVDGIAGPMTINAIAAFQAANGLVPDGIVGANTTTMITGKLTAAAALLHPAA